MATAIVCLSLVVVTGFVGQLSLAQMALAGFGAWVAGRLAAAYDWNFFPAMIVGVAGGRAARRARRAPGDADAGHQPRRADVRPRRRDLRAGARQLRADRRLRRHEAATRRRCSALEIDAFSHPGRYGLVVLVVLTLLSLMVANLRRGRSGLRLLAVRSNERAAAALGVSVPGAKVYAFGLGAAIAGVRRDPAGVPLGDHLLPGVRWVRLDPGRRAVRDRRHRVRHRAAVRRPARPVRHRRPAGEGDRFRAADSSTSSPAPCSSSSCSPTRTASPTPTCRPLARSRVVVAARRPPPSGSDDDGRRSTSRRAVRVRRSTSST